MQEASSLEIWQLLQRHGGNLFNVEEDATFWLWADRSLLGWPRPFGWLFSPIVVIVAFSGNL